MPEVAAPPTPEPAPVGARSTQEVVAACRSGESAACLEAAAQLERPDGHGQVPQTNLRLRDHLLATACLVHQPGLLPACVLRAQAEASAERAAPFWAKACELGATEACER
jgi:hypothetical protein